MENQNEATCVVLSREELFDLYGSWFGNTATPVSYTHLDVYKRQNNYYTVLV